MFLFVLKFMGILVLLFGFGELAGHILKLDKYLKYGSRKSPEKMFTDN